MGASKVALDADTERDLILGYKAQGLSNCAIGVKLGLHKGTIGRKIEKYKAQQQSASPPPQIAPVANQPATSRPQAPTTTTQFDPKAIMLSLAQSGNFNAAKFIIENPTFFKQEQAAPNYHRPVEFSETQHDIVDAIMNPCIKFIIVEGVQRSGKSTSIFCALHEVVIKNSLSKTPRKLQFDLMAGKGEQANRILGDLYRDPLLQEQNKLIATKIADRAVWYDGSQISTHETTVADIKGGDVDIAWVDEFDVAIKKNPDAVTTLLFALRAVKNLKIILSANMDTGVYMLIRDIFKEQSIDDNEVKFFSITSDKAPHLAAAGNDPLLFKIGEAISGKDFVDRRLSNKVTTTGDQFDPVSLKNAFDIYPTFMATQFRSDKPWEESDFNILAVDPSNTGHPFGWFCLGVRGMELFEIESGMMQMGKTDNSGQKWSPDRICEFLLKKCRDYSVKAFVVENNTYGAALYLYMLQHHVKAEFQNFGADGNANSQANFVTVMRHVFDENAIALKNMEIKPQLVLYDITERNKEKFKGDLADALIHAVWKAVGGLEYITSKNQQQKRRSVWSN